MFTPFPRSALDASIPRRFLEQVERHGDTAAVSWDGRTHTYSTLLDRVLRIAALVKDACGADPGAVALMVPQGAEQVAAILGVLEAGGWYVPIDPAQPVEIVRRGIARSEAKLVLAGDATWEIARAGAAGIARALRVAESSAFPPIPAGGTPPDSGRLAYVYFTSGTTGEPKGVMDSHRNVLHNVLRYTDSLRIAPGDRMTLLQAAHFSGAVSNVFGALLNGATVLPYDIERDGAGAPLSRWLVRERATIYHSVPSLFRGICFPGASYPEVRVVRLEGDAGSPGDAERFLRCFTPGAELVHGLGTTETGICRQFFYRHGAPPSGSALPVGHAVQDMDVRVVDEAGVPVPRGETGEIAVRSSFLALGYWRDEPRTRAAFLDVAEPATVDGTRAPIREYRTGDLGRFGAGDCLEHLGRKDLLIKVRGLWVDASAVEARLLELPGVREAAVALERDAGGEAALGAFLVMEPGHALTQGALRSALASALPAHAVPARAHEVPALPLGPNAKLDRRALSSAPGRPLPDPAGCDAPRDAIERELVAIWKEVLGRESVGIHDPFLVLGGDSLKAVEVAVWIEQRLRRSVAHSVLSAVSTVAELAARLRGDPAAATPGALLTLRGTGTRTPLVCVHDLESDDFLFASLTRRLPADQPVFALRRSGGVPVRDLPRTIGALADRYVAEVRRGVPPGPVTLVGFCFGAVVALEMVRRLEAGGGRVERLALVNVTAFDLFGLVSRRAQRRFRGRWGARWTYLRRKPDAVRWVARRIAQAIRDRWWSVFLPIRLALPGEGVASPGLERAVLRAAFRRHTASPHGGALSMFLAAETLPLYADDAREAWDGCATGRVEITMLPHDGYSMLMEPDVAKLAEWVRRGA